MNLNDWAQKIHENAVAHGWWESDRNATEILALIHSEWSEALEEDRAGRPMLYADDYEGSKRIERIEDFPDGAKPEGVAVELIDGVIRILDFLAHEEAEIAWDGVVPSETAAQIADLTVPELVQALHVVTAETFLCENLGYLMTAIVMVFDFLALKGIDPETVMRIKHDFNTRRPYKHGKKY